MCLHSNNDHFYTIDVEVVYTHLTSETLKPSGVDGNIDETEFSEKNEDQTVTLGQLSINSSQLIVWDV